MALLQQLPEIRANDIISLHEELAQRITLALDPELVLDSDIETIFQSLETQIESLKERTERNEIREVLVRYRKLEEVRNGLDVMKEQVQARREALDPNYDPDFPFAIATSARRPAPRPERAGPSRTGSGTVLASDSGVTTLSNVELEPASGPQRHTPSIRGHRHQATPFPSSRPRLSLPSDCQTFDVVFLPFIYTHHMELADASLRAAQNSLQRLGLVFQVYLPRTGGVQSYFDCQVKGFCEAKHIDLTRSLNPGPLVTDWILMKRKGNKSKLTDEVLSPAEFTTSKLKDKPFTALRNYLSEDVTRKILLIAPMFGDLKGAINLPDVDTPQMKHYCHVSRVVAAIKEKEGTCSSRCPPVVSPVQRPTTGRTL
ncbi:hypothetical protein C8R44DRAFT_789663, partial [Mycena epipterygia]